MVSCRPGYVQDETNWKAETDQGKVSLKAETSLKQIA